MALRSSSNAGIWVCAWLLSCGAETADPGSDSSTHFFSRCELSAECGEGYSCECNRCTVACTSDDQCGSEGTCAPASDALSCDLEGNVCAPKSVVIESASGDEPDAGPSEPLPVPVPTNETPAAAALPTTADASVPAQPAGGVVDSPDAAVPDFMDAGLPAPVPILPEPDPSELVEAGVPPEPVNPEPVSPCPGAPECEWVELPPVLEAIRGHAVVSVDGTLYSFGGGTWTDFVGENAELYSATFAYDIEAAEWSPRAAMPVGAYMLAAHPVGDRILVQTGYGAAGFVNALLSYDPAEDTWFELSPMPSYRYIFTTGVVGDRLYVIGGNGTIDDMPQGSQDWEYKDYVQVYDIATDTWSEAAPEPEPTGGAASCTLGSRIYVFGGDTSNRTTIYDASTDSWSEATPPPVARNAHTCVTVGSVFYLLGGRVSTGGELATVERYDPGTDTWTRLPDMPSGRQWFGAAVVDADVYVVAGQTDTGTLLDSVWLYHTAE